MKNNVYTPTQNTDGAFELSESDMADLKRRHESTKIRSALLKLAGENEPVEVHGDIEPCSICGSTDFLRTGTCHACMTCGASQGCS